MREPIGRDPSPPRREPRTYGLDRLISPYVFTLKGYEEEQQLSEQRREALVKVLNEADEPRQFIIIILLDLHSKMLSVTIEPTYGAVQNNPELQDVKFTGFGQQAKGVATIIQQAVEKMSEAGYQLDPVALRMLHGG